MYINVYEGRYDIPRDTQLSQTNMIKEIYLIECNCIMSHVYCDRYTLEGVYSSSPEVHNTLHDLLQNLSKEKHTGY